MNTWQKFWSSYYGFNKQQRNGLLVLIFLILALFVVRLSIHRFIKPEAVTIADFSHIKFFQDEKINEINKNVNKKNKQLELFVFNPNTVTKEQLIKLGFKEKTAGTLINYRNKGGKFYKKEDLKKVYGVNDYLYNKLESYILIKDAKTPLPESFDKKTSASGMNYQKKKIELNTADSLSLLSLRGIGPGYTKRILKYRSLLGGFYSVDQIAEVYGISDSLFQSIKNNLTVDASLVTKINLNTENFKELNKHPYVSYEDTKAIFNWRRKNGEIKSLAQLKEILNNEETIKKLQAYLPFE